MVGIENFKCFCIGVIINLIIFLLIVYPASAAGWPSESQWNIVTKNGTVLNDPYGDAQGEKDIVGNMSYPCCYFFNNGTALFFRMRLDDYPIQGGGHLKAFGWGLEIDSNSNLNDYEWLIIIDGTGNSAMDENVTIQKNTVQNLIGIQAIMQNISIKPIHHL